MALTVPSRIVMRAIGCILIMLLMSSAQAINYDVHRNDVISMTLKSNVIFTSSDFLEELNSVALKENTLQEDTEYLLYFGALLRTRILDTFGSLLYIYYDDFSVAEVEALHKVYQEILERRYDIFNLVPGVLKNADNMRPSKICAGIYAHAESCLRDNANICRRIGKQHDLPHPEDLDTPTFNVTHVVYRFSKISKQYRRGFSPVAVLKLLQREVLTITPALLSGLLYNVRYDDFDDDVRSAEKKLIRYFREVELKSFNAGILKSLPMRELKKLHTVNLLLKYYIGIQAEKFSDDDLKKCSLLIAKRIVDDVGTINENILLLGNVYENRMIHIEYLFDLVLPDDTLDNDVIEAKKYLVRKLNEFDVIEKYLKVQKYQQATPGQLMMEITGQLKDIDFAKDIATSLRIHAKFWRRSIMIENLDELLELFDAYENLRQIPQYRNMTQNIDAIKESLDKKNVTVEILCHAPRACLRIGLQSILRCRYVNPEIKRLIKIFLVTSNMCVVPMEKSMVHIPAKFSKFFTAKKSIIWIKEATTEPKSISETTRRSSTTEAYKTTTDNFESESTEKVPAKPDILLKNSSGFARTTTIATTLPTTISKTINPVLTTTMDTTVSQEETTAVSSVTTTTSPTTTTTTSPTTTTTIMPITTIILPTTISTSSPTTTTTSPTTTTTILPTINTTVLSSTTFTSSPTTITATSPTTTTTILPTTTTTVSTTTAATLPTTTTTMSSTTNTTSPAITKEIPITEEPKNSTFVTTAPEDKINDTVISITTFCEYDECITEQKNTTESIETTTVISLTTTSTMQPFITLETIRTTSSVSSSTLENNSSESTVVTKLSETPVTKGDNCKSSCSEECRSKSESSIERSKKSCETDCDSVMEDCNEASPETPSECKTEIDRSWGCVSKEEKSIECVTKCSSDEENAPCNQEPNDCSTSNTSSPTDDLTIEFIRKRGICDIRDPHHQRQMKRLAKMRRAIGADVFRSGTRRQSRIATKKLYNLLATKLPHSKAEKFKRAEYLLKKSLDNLKEVGSRKRRKQQIHIYRLRKKLMKKLGRKKLRDEPLMH